MLERDRWTQARVRELALSLPEARESSHHGRPDLRVRDRIFATFPPDGRTVNLKTTALDLHYLRSSDPDTFRDAWSGSWVGVDLERVEPETLRALVVEAWRLAAPRRLVGAYRAGGGPKDEPLPRNGGGAGEGADGRPAP